MQSFLSPDWNNRSYINANYTIWPLCNISILWLKELNPKTPHWLVKSGSHWILPVYGPTEDNAGAEPPLPYLLTLPTSSPPHHPALVTHGLSVCASPSLPTATCSRVSSFSHPSRLLSSLSGFNLTGLSSAFFHLTIFLSNLPLFTSSTCFFPLLPE